MHYKTRLPNCSPNSTSLCVNKKKKKKSVKKTFLLLNSYLHSIKVAHNNMGLIKQFSIVLLEERFIIPHPAGSGLNTEKDTKGLKVLLLRLLGFGVLRWSHAKHKCFSITSRSEKQLYVSQ